MLSYEFHLEVASDAYFGKGTDIAFKVVFIKHFVPDCSAWLPVRDRSLFLGPAVRLWMEHCCVEGYWQGVEHGQSVFREKGTTVHGTCFICVNRGHAITCDTGRGLGWQADREYPPLLWEEYYTALKKTKAWLGLAWKQMVPQWNPPCVSSHCLPDRTWMN